MSWAIQIEGLGKRYRRGAVQHLSNNFRESLKNFAKAALSGRHIFNSSKTDSSAFWAIRDINLNIQQGEVVGVIGQNGAGKSTLLKILSRITPPTCGLVRYRGRVASLLEVGTGFHRELTGYENIYLNGAILGMRRAEISRKMDEIVNFAGVEKFLDTPVKFYSSGMYVRLAFAVAAHLESEVLVIDEVLAVGDAEFQKKCLGKIHEVSSGGRTVLFVSHNMSAVQALCSKVVCLQKGAVLGVGDTDEWIAKYLASSQQTVARRLASPVRMGETLELIRFDLTPNPAESGARISFSLELFAHQANRLSEMTILIYSSLEVLVAILDFRSSGLPVSLAAGQTWKMDGLIKSLPVVEGEYKFSLYVSCSDFTGELPDLVALNVGSQKSRGSHVPYPSVHRGVIELEFAVNS